MKQILVIFLAFITLTSCSEAQEKTADGAVNEVVSAEKFKSLISDEVQLIDVRTPSEYDGGKIGDAVNIDFYGANFAAELEKLDKTKTVLVYCAAGGRSGKAAKKLAKLGFKEVYDLKGGYGNWPYK